MPDTSSEIPSPASEADNPVTSETTAETTPGLEERLQAAEQKASEHQDAWLRAKAETENLRRRAQEDVARAHKYAAEKFASELLPVKDSLEAALAAQNTTIESLQDGVTLTLKQLTAAFDRSGVAEINPVDARFDPNLHQAINAIEDDGEPNRVLQILQKGYALNERVLRPALVIVSKARGA